MRFFLNIIDNTEVGNGEIIYKTEDGRCFIGNPIIHFDGEMIVVEATNEPVEYGCHRIIKLHEHVRLKR